MGVPYMPTCCLFLVVCRCFEVVWWCSSGGDAMCGGDVSGLNFAQTENRTEQKFQFGLTGSKPNFGNTSVKTMMLSGCLECGERQLI